MAGEKDKPDTRKCDNHPDVDALLVTDGGNAFEEIALCTDCVPDSLK